MLASGPGFSNSAIVGGGFIGVLARSPGGTLIAGGDTQGLFRSVDGGTTWSPQDNGLQSPAYHVAALLNQGTTWYASVGNATTGGIAVSTDDGLSWSFASAGGTGAPPLFDGSNLPGQRGHPRATGNLLATDGTYLYAATFGEGLQRWLLTSSTLASGWQCVALCTSYLNSMVLDGSGNAFVSAITQTGGSVSVDEITGIAGQATATAINGTSGVSTGVQELLYLGSRLYVAGAYGIGYWANNQWTTIDTTTHWYTLAGYETVAGSSPTDVLYAAAYSGHASHDVEQLTVHGTAVTITALVPPGSVSITVSGTSTPWWEATSAGTAGANLGPSSTIGGCKESPSPLCSGSGADAYVGSNILLLSQNGGNDSMLVAGHSGIWYRNASASPAWSPSVTGLSTTFDLAAAVDPANSSNVAVADEDWNVIASTDRFAGVDTSVHPPLLPSAKLGLGITWDASVSPSALILSAANRTSNTQGSIWYSAGWATGGSWTSLPLPASVTARPIALAAHSFAPGAYVLVAAFQSTAVYAFSGSGATGSWSLIPSAGSGGPKISPQDLHGVSLSWAADGSAVYMYDEGTHSVWKSSVSSGVFLPWAKLYTNKKPSPGRGWVVSDPAMASVVWVADSNGLGDIELVEMRHRLYTHLDRCCQRDACDGRAGRGIHRFEWQLRRYGKRWCAADVLGGPGRGVFEFVPERQRRQRPVLQQHRG